jgi:phage terminase large subunit-like protein
MTMTDCLIKIKHSTTQYALDVDSGKIVAGKYVILACKRHLNDLERQGNDDFPYIFDEPKADKVFSFAEKHCRHIEDGLTVRKGDPITLDPFLKFIVGSVFGWVHKDTGLRRFRKAFEQVARKNSKSTTLSVVGLYMFAADGEGGPQVYTAGTQRDQAKIVYGASEQMVELDKPLRKRIRIQKSRSTMTHKKNGGRMMPLSRETKKMDGFNPHCGIIDEYHAHPTSDMYDVIISGMGMRRQPLLFVITTAGFNLSSPCYSEYRYCKKVLEGIYDNDEYFIYIAEMDEDDDINDESNWIKANPLLAQTPEGMKYLRGELKIAQEMPEKQRGVFTKNFNLWVDQKDNGFLPLSKWEKCGSTKDNPMPDLTNLECYVGGDLSKKIDLTSISFEFPLDDGRYAVLSHSFIPEDTLAEKRQTDKVPYDLWVKQGWITVTPGAVTDYKFVFSYIIRIAGENGWKIREICFDPYNASQLIIDFQDEGYEAIEIRQGYQTLSGPTKDFRDMVYMKRIIHDNNPVLRWAFSNAVIRQDHNENIMLDKDKSPERIDPAAAVIDSHVRAMINEDSSSVYDEAGFTFL